MNETKLPKGTIVKINGCAVELLEEVKVKGSLVTDTNTSSPSKPFNNDGGAMEEFPAAFNLS
jgi:hypothetical protein